MSPAPLLTLSTGALAPQLGFGVFQVAPADTAAAVSEALAVGYRSIDTAAIYGNEAEVGQALAASGLPRQDLFVTTKLWNADQGYDATMVAFEASLARLGLEQLDLYLIHWPAPERDLYVDTWRAMEKLQADGRALAIGVSNFRPAHLERLLAETSVVPAVNQIELHPRLAQRELRALHARHGIVTEAWSPLARGGLWDDPAVLAVAGRHGVTPAQAILRWHVQLGNMVIPRSVRPQRIRENFDVFGFALGADDMAALDALDVDGRIGPDPDRFN